jgi:prepilin-type N-terminal cleavage/methylation domain-containing protein
MKCNTKGFTMIELLVVLLIIAVLAAVATPMYLANAEKAKLTEAVAAMSMIRQAERERYVKKNAYLAVANGDLQKDDANGGLDIDLGGTQYFSTKAYNVTTGGTFSDGSAASNFVVQADGSATNNEAYVDDTGKGARKNTDVAEFLIEMDNSGKILYSSKLAPKDGTRTWKEY